MAASNPQSDFLTYLAQTNPYPIQLEVARAEGVYLYGSDGKAYTDMISGLAVTNVGHRHPHVVKAIKEQVDRYMHVIPYGEFIQSPQTELARKLATLLPGCLSATYIVNSVAEAVEGALKLAKRYTGRRELIACLKSYHGSTHGALSVSGNEKKRTAFEPLLPGVSWITFNDVADLERITESTAAVIVETVQGDAGVRIPTPAYMQALRQRCDDTGALLILDEIQTGFGRTGTMFAFEQYDVVPDILVIAKALGGGMPLGAFIARPEVMKTLSFEPMLGHITTFGGHPVCCAAALASIEVIEDGLLPDVEQKGRLIRELLDHPIVREIRQTGLMLAIDLPSEEITYKVVARCLERGVITFFFLSNPASFRLAPPLTITEEEIRWACGEIRGVFEEVSKE